MAAAGILICCKEDLTKKELPLSYKDLDAIVTEHQNILTQTVKKMGADEKGQTISLIIGDNFGFRNHNADKNLKQLRAFEKYLKDFYRPYDSICMATISKLERLDAASANNKSKRAQIEKFRNTVEVSIAVLKSYRNRATATTAKVGEMLWLAKECQYHISKKDIVIFSSPNCYENYNSKLKEIDELAYDMNASRDNIIRIATKN